MSSRSLPFPASSSKALSDFVRASSRSATGGSTAKPRGLARLTGEEICEIAERWRKRVESGDHRADAVADALEMVGNQRCEPASPSARLRAAARRITDFMQL
ncbi:MAG: hypothetical protein WKG52_17565 [Variovorax sp.]